MSTVENPPSSQSSIKRSRSSSPATPLETENQHNKKPANSADNRPHCITCSCHRTGNAFNKRSKARRSESSDFSDSEIPSVPKPKQPTISVVDPRLVDILKRLGTRKHTQWTKQEKADICSLMANRDGFKDCSNSKLQRDAGVLEQWRVFEDEYIDCYNTDPEFERAIFF